MNWLDIAILVVIGIAGLFGLRIGMIKAALSLAGLIVGVILAGRYYMLLSQQLPFIPQAGAKALAFTIIMAVVMIIAGLLARILRWAISMVMLGWVNHLGGAILGLVMGAIFCSALLAIWVKFFDIAEAIADSKLASLLLNYFPIVLALLPDEFDRVRSFFR